MSDIESVQSRTARQKRWLSFLTRNKRIPIPEDHERRPYGYYSANFISKYFFWWLIPLMNVGYHRTLHPQDFFKLTEELTVEYRLQQFRQCFESRLVYYKEDWLQKQRENEKIQRVTTDDDDENQHFEAPKFIIAECILRVFWRDLLISTIYGAIICIGMSCVPFVTKKLINFVQRKELQPDISVGPGIGYAVGTVLMTAISGASQQQFGYYAQLVGIQVRSVLTQLILEKSFNLSPKSKHKYSSGDITSLLTTDLSRMSNAIMHQAVVLVLPIPLGISIAILIINVGVSAIISIFIFLLFLGALGYFAKSLYNFRAEVAPLTDKRVGLIREIVTNMKMIKLYSWERPYWYQLTVARAEEISVIFKIQALRSLMFALMMSLTTVTTMIAFLILYGLENHIKSAGSMFSSVQSFQNFGFFVFFIPQVLSSTADLLNGCKRVGKFLTCDELEPNDSYRAVQESADDTVISIKNGYFEWEVFPKDDEKGDKSKKELKKELKKERKKKKKEKLHKRDSQLESVEGISESHEIKIMEISEDHETKPQNFSIESEENKTTEEDEVRGKLLQLSDINLSIKRKEFVVITGMIGTGKSSLLNAINGTMSLTKGSVDINGSILSSGEPWVQNATIRDNILFGNEFDQKWYDAVIHACCLQHDLGIFTAGDLTEVGERGITLSGGQKARLCLARAVYTKSDIILLDDILSAVDVKVGQHVIKHCFYELLKDKTIVLATHQLSLVGSADRIIFMNGDGTIEVGTQDALRAKNGAFDKLIKLSFSEMKDEKQKEDIGEGMEAEALKNLSITRSYQRQESQESKYTEDDESVYDVSKPNMDSNEGKLVLEEERAVNKLKLEVYYNYVKLGAKKLTVPGFLCLLVILVSLNTFCQLFTNTWLSFWISQKFTGRPDNFYIGIYVMLTLSGVILSCFELVFLVKITTKASQNLTLEAAKKVMYSTMNFLDTNPMGRIMNRFTKDTDALDNEISSQLTFSIDVLGKIVGSVILSIIYIPWVGIAVPPMAVVFVCVANYYQASAREIRRLEAVSRSFVYNVHSEVLAGTGTINAFGASSRFLDKNRKVMNKLNEASYLVLATEVWFNIHLEIIAACFTLIVSILSVNRVFNINAASVGLVITYTLQLSNLLTMLLDCLTKVENDMNSVERLCQYALHLTQEQDESDTNYMPQQHLDDKWPSEGQISFQNASMAYRPGLPLVLKNLNFKIGEPDSKRIGICGRTGAGKSSIMTALYRLSELNSGKILIDDIDISELNLRSLRSKLSIIPQDPVLFNGSIRRNIDPFGEFDDEILWDALRRCGAVEKEELSQVRAQAAKTHGDNSGLHKFHLEQEVVSEGTNFSLGERQLISFARALVRDSKILILDEATSSVDYETDKKIQHIIDTEFKGVTILCIAHRLRTIIHYDRIMVLDGGELKEFDSPINLFHRDDGIFKSMCIKSGINFADLKE